MKKYILLICMIVSFILISENNPEQPSLNKLIDSVISGITTENTEKEQQVENDKFLKMTKEELDLYVKIYLDKKNENEIYRIARAYAILNYPETANIVASLSNSDRNIYLKATTDRMQGNYSKAISNYSKILSKNPNHLNSILGIGISYAKNGDKSKALEYLLKYDSLKPSVNVRVLINELR